MLLNPFHTYMYRNSKELNTINSTVKQAETLREIVNICAYSGEGE
jgi:hypothetical protein